jgi:ABC-type branched-subunit amino acid transport system ATPase component
MAALLEVEDVRCGYGADEVVHGVSLSLEEGRLIAILGPNGCGKSTLMKAILGYLPVKAGAVRLKGMDLARRGADAVSRLGIGYVPQLANVFRPLSVIENLEMGGYRLDPKAREHRIADMFATFPLLAERRRQIAGTLSGGERQLLAIARALMPEPRMLCLDEPSAGLSPIKVGEVFATIAEIVGRGTAILLVEQDVHSALSIADFGYVLAAGRVVFEGTSQAIAGDPRMQEAFLGRRARL